MAIDLYGLSETEVRTRLPELYQHVLTRVKPERDANNREGYRRNWWIHGEPRKDLRLALTGLKRYIVTTETSKHRFFQFLGSEVLPDNMLVVIAAEDGFFLGVLSSRIHTLFALASGGTLEDRPRYNKSRCFDPFPFPPCDQAARERIRKIAEELDAHRKRVQAKDPSLTLTSIYNVLEKLRTNEPLTQKEQRIHDHGLVSVLRQLHDDLDFTRAKSADVSMGQPVLTHAWLSPSEDFAALIASLEAEPSRCAQAEIALPIRRRVQVCEGEHAE
jgi:hypothetical protein